MRAFRRKLPAALLAIALMAVAAPAWPGGRDVPDRQSNDLAGPQRPDRNTPGSGDGTCPETVRVSTVTFGGLSFDLVWSEAEGYRLQPSFWTAVGRLGQLRDRGSCPTS